MCVSLSLLNLSSREFSLSFQKGKIGISILFQTEIAQAGELDKSISLIFSRFLHLASVSGFASSSCLETFELLNLHRLQFRFLSRRSRFHRSREELLHGTQELVFLVSVPLALLLLLLLLQWAACASWPFALFWVLSLLLLLLSLSAAPASASSRRPHRRGRSFPPLFFRFLFVFAQRFVLLSRSLVFSDAPKSYFQGRSF